MEFLLFLIDSFILEYIVQLQMFKAALFCFVSLGLPFVCCTMIWGYLAAFLEAFSKRNLRIITVYHNIKEPPERVFVGAAD